MSLVSHATTNCNGTGSTELSSGHVTSYFANFDSPSSITQAKQWYTTNNNCLAIDSNGGSLLKQPEMRTLQNGFIMDGDSCITSEKMKVVMGKLTAMLVSVEEDEQCEVLKKAAELANFKVVVMNSTEEAYVSYQQHQHDLVIIDCRHKHSQKSKYFNQFMVCKSLRSTHPKAATRFMAVTTKQEKEEKSISTYLKAGFTRVMAESTSVMSCQNELLSIERGEIRPHLQMQVYKAMAEGLLQVEESVEVMDSKFRTEFVNGAFEKVTGYTADEVLGADVQERLQVDNFNEEQSLVHHMKKAETKNWEGIQSVRRKNGDTVQCRCKVIPVRERNTPPGKGRYVVVKNYAHLEDSWERFNDSRNRILNYRKSEARTTRIHSLTIEAPINKVISMLYDAQQSSPSNLRVVEAIDKVLEILQTTELFAPHIHQVKEEDPLTNDYVGGLCDKSSISSKTKTGAPHRRSLNNRPNSALKLQPSTHHSTPEIEQILQGNASWDFDIIKLESLTSKNTLVPLGLKIFERFGVMEYLEVDQSVVQNWLQLISSNYHAENSYHNATHAADVLQATAYFLEKIRPKYYFKTHHEVAALIAAVIHDVDHPARTSSFLVNCKHKLAVLYNDTSVLENHHAATGFQLTHQHIKSDILANLKRKRYDKLRKIIIDMVIYTDMGRHFETVEKFSLLCSVNRFLPSTNSSLNETTSNVKNLIGTGLTYITIPVEPVSISMVDDSCTQILRMCIKVADVSNPARPRHLMKTWAYRIAEEYFDQYDEEQALSIPAAMPSFRRSDCNIPKSQLGFAELFLDKMFMCWSAFIDIPEVTGQLQDNYNYWQEMNVEEDTNSNPSITKSV